METSPQLKLIASELRTLSSTLVLSGAISILIGILALVAPLPTLAALVLLFGVYAIVDGLLALVAAARSLRRHARAWPQAVRGVAGVFVGLFALAFPPVTGVVLLVIAAIWAVVIGVLELLAAARLRRATGRAWLFALYGVVSIAFGAFLVLSPAGLFAAAALIGMYALARGVIATWVGFSIRHAVAGV
ncbi:MAG: HdeD family acid-resistance protein [Gemmatimonadaceae bacterium]